MQRSFRKEFGLVMVRGWEQVDWSCFLSFSGGGNKGSIAHRLGPREWSFDMALGREFGQCVKCSIMENLKASRREKQDVAFSSIWKDWGDNSEMSGMALKILSSSILFKDS